MGAWNFVILATWNRHYLLQLSYQGIQQSLAKLHQSAKHPTECTFIYLPLWYSTYPPGKSSAASETRLIYPNENLFITKNSSKDDACNKLVTVSEWKTPFLPWSTCETDSLALQWPSVITKNKVANTLIGWSVFVNSKYKWPQDNEK